MTAKQPHAISCTVNAVDHPLRGPYFLATAACPCGWWTTRTCTSPTTAAHNAAKFDGGHHLLDAAANPDAPDARITGMFPPRSENAPNKFAEATS